MRAVVLFGNGRHDTMCTIVMCSPQTTSVVLSAFSACNIGTLGVEPVWEQGYSMFFPGIF